MAAVGHDGTVAALQVFDGGHEAMTFRGVGACGTGMVFVESEAMGPTVKHGNAIIGGNCMCGCRKHGRADRSGFLRQFGRGHGCGISTVVTDSTGGDGFVEVFFVFGCEKCAKLDVGLIGGRAEAPHVARQREDASGLEHD